MPRAAQDAFLSDLGLVQEVVHARVNPVYAWKKDGHWNIWVEYCSADAIDSYSTNVVNPFPYLQVFAHWYHNGRIAACGNAFKSKTVSDVLQSVGQGFASLGTLDPRLISFGKQDFCLGRQVRSYQKFDRPLVRVNHLPIFIVLCLFKLSLAYSSDRLKALANLICIAFYFCLRPGEYTVTTSNDHAFSLNDVGLFSLYQQLSLCDTPDHLLITATHVTYTFIKQKYMNDGQVIANARSDHHLCCPVTATIQQVLLHHKYCWRFHKPFVGSRRLASYYSASGTLIPLPASAFTTIIRIHAASLCSTTRVAPSEFSACSLWVGGAMALLSGGCNSNIIKLLGEWKSGLMMDYLHEQSLPIVKRLAAAMFNNGHHSFLLSKMVAILA